MERMSTIYLYLGVTIAHTTYVNIVLRLRTIQNSTIICECTVLTITCIFALPVWSPDRIGEYYLYLYTHYSFQIYIWTVNMEKFTTDRG